jgi:hypothetical protein
VSSTTRWQGCSLRCARALGEARKRFILKKKPKLALHGIRVDPAKRLKNKGFLVLFCKKEPLPSLPPITKS